jgi:predicted nucleic acid-binding protein
MISTFTVVFDSNVLYGARLRSLLMELTMSGLFRARWSADIHREWMNAVHSDHGIPKERLEATKNFMDAAVPEACITGYEPLIPALDLPDPNDRHVLAAAIRAGASAIVTFNEKDFPAAVLQGFGLHTRHPDQFIRDVDGVDPGVLAATAEADFKHYENPPLTPDQYVADLRRAGVPRTADYLDGVRVLWA